MPKAVIVEQKVEFPEFWNAQVSVKWEFTDVLLMETIYKFIITNS
jgi:hypothetical protein